MKQTFETPSADIPALNQAAAALNDQDQAAAIGYFRAALTNYEAQQQVLFQQSSAVEILVQQRSNFIDQIICLLWQHFFNNDSDNIALVAIGGYGRSELHPKSDVDLLLLSTSEKDQAQEPFSAFLAFLWDIKLDIGHSRRSIQACARDAAEDVTILTGLLEARYLCGSRDLFAAMRHVTAESRIWSKKDFFHAKLREQQQRHQKFHETAYRLEPNIKEGPGSLRDIQTISWVAKRYFNAENLRDLHTLGFLSADEFNALLKGREHLWRIRFALHSHCKRREDRLLFEYQHELAKQFGHKDHPGSLAVEQFMQAYYQTVTELERLNELLLQLLQEAIEYPQNDPQPRLLNDHFQATQGYLEARYADIFLKYPSALLEVFLIMMRHPELKGVRAGTIRLIRGHRHLIDIRFRAEPANRALFMTMLQEPSGVTREFRRMNRYGILAAYLPVFAPIVGRMQYDLFHIYTVDVHTLFVLRNIRRFSTEKHRQWQPLCSKIFPTLRHPENLYIAGLFHDIAKGRGGDHSELGALDAEQFCRTHGMNTGNTKIVKWLVKNHLLMSITAQRKDINDPAVIHSFATQVGDLEVLDYLYLLTIADISATNPELLTSWKEQLLLELYERSKQALRQGLAQPVDLDARIHERQDNACQLLQTHGISVSDCKNIWLDFDNDYFLQHSADEIAWHTQAIAQTSATQLPLILIRKQTKRGSSAIFIYARENDGFFAISANTLSKLGLNVVDARIITSKSGYTLDTYMVLDQQQAIEDDFRAQEIAQRLSQALQNPHALSEIRRRPLPRQLQFFKMETKIQFSQDKDEKYTLVSTKTLDRPGLLAHIGQAFFESGTRIHNAKISTLGEIADNIFTVSDQHNRPITTNTAQQQIRAKLLSHINGNHVTKNS